MRQHQRALAEVVQEQRRQHEEQPRGLDRLAAEVAEIGVERLPAGDDQKHGAQRHETDVRMRADELDRVPGIDRRQHARIVADMREAEHRQRQEPDDHHRPEGGRDHRRAAALHREQRNEDQDRQRNDVVLQRGRRELQALHRRKHRDRRRDHRIADEHRRADDAEHQQRQGPASERAVAERHQRQRAALAVVVGAQQQQHVLRGDDDQQRPDDQRQHAEHDVARDRPAMRGGVHGLAERIQRRRADIAIDDADAADGQRGEARMGARLGRSVGG